MSMTTTYSIYDTEGRLVDCGYTEERTACIAAKLWANGNGEGCVVVSSDDESDALHDVTPDWQD